MLPAACGCSAPPGYRASGHFPLHSRHPVKIVAFTLPDRTSHTRKIIGHSIEK